MKSDFLLQILGPLLVVTGMHFPAHAIVKLEDLKPEQTPLLVQGLETKLKAYQEAYPGEKLESFWFEFTENVRTQVYNGLYGIKADPDKALAEIKSVYDIRFPGLSKPRVIDDFERIKNDIISRGYEASQNTYWAEPKYLNLQYQKMSQAGPRYEEPSNGRPAAYSHAMTFELRMSYQPKGKVLEDGQDYPEIFLRGRVYFRCAEPLQKCRAFNAWFDEAGITWKTIPALRGGGSSAGGGH